ncbi:uncharacterized protein LOC141908162 [Tubulanus polymorphus]|uniref:uncharacterized protein LOC141908162 n=1 Tax=Tubulanus polymorphus TaxID=672921 RepID=UPI003DA601EB
MTRTNHRQRRHRVETKQDTCLQSTGLRPETKENAFLEGYRSPSADELGLSGGHPVVKTTKRSKETRGRLKSRTGLQSAGRKQKRRSKRRPRVAAPSGEKMPDKSVTNKDMSYTETEESSIQSSSRDASTSRSSPELTSRYQNQPGLRLDSSQRDSRKPRRGSVTPATCSDEADVSDSDCGKQRRQQKSKKRMKRKKKRKTTQSDRDVTTDRKTPIVIRGRPESLTPPSSPENSNFVKRTTDNTNDFSQLNASPRLPPLEKKFLVHAPDFHSDFKNHYDQYSSRKVKAQNLTTPYCMYTQQDPNRRPSRGTYSSTDNPHDFWLEHLRRTSENAFFQKSNSLEIAFKDKDRQEILQAMRKASRNRSHERGGQMTTTMFHGKTSAIVTEQFSHSSEPRRNSHQTNAIITVSDSCTQNMDFSLKRKPNILENEKIESTEEVELTASIIVTDRTGKVESHETDEKTHHVVQIPRVPDLDDFEFVTFSDEDAKTTEVKPTSSPSVEIFVDNMIEKSVNKVLDEIPSLDLSQLNNDDHQTSNVSSCENVQENTEDDKIPAGHSMKTMDCIEAMAESSEVENKEAVVGNSSEELSPHEVLSSDINDISTDADVQSNEAHLKSQKIVANAEELLLALDDSVPTCLELSSNAYEIFPGLFNKTTGETPAKKFTVPEPLTTPTADEIALTTPHEENHHSDSDISENIEIYQNESDEITLDTSICPTPSGKLGQPKKQVRFHGYKTKRKH